MASDIIIIEDTPPSSPVSNEKNLTETEVLDLTLDEFSDSITSNGSTSPWEHLRNKFIRNNMDLSLVDKIIDNPAITCEVVNLTKTKCNENSVVTQKEITSNVPQSGNDTIPKYSYYPGYYFKPENIQIGSYCFPVYENRTCSAPFPYAQQLGKTFTNYYGKNYMSNTKLNETMKYARPNLMQRASCNFLDDCNSQFMPEYIDINNFMNYNFDKSPTNDLTFDKTQQTTEDDTRSTAFKNNKRYNKNSVPLFLKRNRSVNAVFSCNKMKVLDLSSDTLNEQKNKNDITIEKVQESKDDDDSDVVYVGAYARDPIYPALQPTIYKLPHMDIGEQQQERRESQEVETFVVESSQSSDSNDACERFHFEEKDNETDNCGVKGKRKRKPPVTVPRRNPKRQVQIEKDYLKLLDNVICESKKEVKVKKPKKTNKSISSVDKKKGDSGNRRPTRQPTNCGAVYRPPSPLAKHHFRHWPVSGMHERPEFNPVSGKLEPFDSIIRNISANYQPSKKSDGASNLKSNKDDEIREENKNLSTLCHEMFHHVFAYGATVKAMQKEEEKTDVKDVEKINFMKDLSLLSDVACNPLNLTVQNKMESSDKEESSSQEPSLTIKELMENSLLLYCLTNHDIDRVQLSKYIETLDPDELIKWSNREFDLVE